MTLRKSGGMRLTASFFTLGLEFVFALGRLPTPISVPLLFVTGTVAQGVGFVCQGFRWLRSMLITLHRPGEGGEHLRTPAERFEGLEGWDYVSNFFEHCGARLAYVDVGPRDAKELIVLIHGMPAWGYCYRNMIPKLEGAGHRVIALDFNGCGQSDKASRPCSYQTFRDHVSSIPALLDHIGVAHDSKSVTLCIHDWGSLIGQTSLPLLGGRLKRLVLFNAFVGRRLFGGLRGMMLFVIWQGLSRMMGTSIPVGAINVADAGGPSLVSAGVEAGYDAPFPSAAFKEQMAGWPLFYGNKKLVVGAYADALEWMRSELDVPVLVAFGESDLILEVDNAHDVLSDWLLRAPRVIKRRIAQAGHFPMENNPEQTARAVLDFMQIGCVDPQTALS